MHQTLSVNPLYFKEYSSTTRHRYTEIPSPLCFALFPCRLAVRLMHRGVVLGITGSFTGVDASGRFRQGTLFKGR